MASVNFEQLEAELRTLSENKGILGTHKKQIIRDRLFQSIGQIQLADAIATGETKASLAVSLKHLRQAMLPHRLAFSMPATIATVLMVFMGSIITGAAAQSAKPGEVLFNVKKVLETMELAVTSNPTKKAEMSLGIAGQRVKDLEASVGQEEALHTVLLETQSALTSARATIQKAKDSGDEAGAAALVEKFNTLLADQKTILADIEATSPNDDIKQTIVAIRDVIADEVNPTPETGDTTASVANSVSPKTTIKPINSNQQPPALATTLEGFKALSGRLGTAGGQPVIYFNGNQYCIIASTPVDLQAYVGAGNVALTGPVKAGYMAAQRVVVNGTVLADIIPQSNPVSTGGNPDSSDASAQPATQE